MKRRDILTCIFILSVAISLITFGQVLPAQTSLDNHDAFLSVRDYDKQKNCTTDLGKRPTSIEYLTHFNCGRVSEGDNGQTKREFTLVIEENQNITISNTGHYFDAWTFNGTVPGPTMRMTEGDLIRINVINSKDSKHSHSLHMHSIHPAEIDG
ncbi:MAG: multicopper oxidase domain-containing protein, partial [Nitrososphaeraceae archaeon]